MAKIHGHVKIEIENCKGCELCVNECPQDSLEMSKNINKKGYHYAVLNDDTCTGCTNCALVCPEAIITVYRESKTAKEKIATISDVKDNISISVN
ncbi:ferredoxin family protein [Candidatus Neomarinimicrobiota bacterium]